MLLRHGRVSRAAGHRTIHPAVVVAVEARRTRAEALPAVVAEAGARTVAAAAVVAAAISEAAFRRPRPK